MKQSVIINSVQDILEPTAPLSAICEQGESYVLCNPADVIIRHSQKNCEIDIINAIVSPKPIYPNCEFNSVKLNADEQYALIIKGKLSVSTESEDELHYICDKPEYSKTVPLKAGFSIYDTIDGCVYETSTLTVYNGPKSTVLSDYSDADSEINIINALASMESLLDGKIMVDYSNTSNIESIVGDYEKLQGETEVTYKKLISEIRIAQDVEQLSDFTPLKVDLRRPLHQNNWIAAVTWCIVFFFILTIFGTICKICPNCFPMIWTSIVWCCIGYWSGLTTFFSSCRKSSAEPVPAVSVELHENGEGEVLISPTGLPPVVSAPPQSYLDVKGSVMMDPNMSDTLYSVTKRVRYPNLETHYQETRPRHEWGISKGRYNEYLITSSVPDGNGGNATVYYDIVEGQAIDQYNRPLPYIASPDLKLIQIYRDKVLRSTPPTYLTQDNVMYLPGAPHIIFSVETNHWINKITKRIISGLNRPQGW